MADVPHRRYAPTAAVVVEELADELSSLHLPGNPSGSAELPIRRAPRGPLYVQEEEEKADGRPQPTGEQLEIMRFKRVGRKKDFELVERVRGRDINILRGLELHTNVFNPEEQKRIVDYIYDIQEKGRRGELRERTYSEPRKWMRGKGRVTIQFGCCYNYAVDKNGNPPGIIRNEDVDPIPPLLKTMIKRMVAWHVLPPTCVPNSCIINIYDKDDCIPPHIDHHDFLRPFCTVSFLSECNILFGSELKILGPGEFSGSARISLPVGSVLILNGNGADVAKHCVPAVPAKRISITFRKMDESKIPYKFKPDPELQNIKPLVLGKTPSQQTHIIASPIQQQGTFSSQAPRPSPSQQGRVPASPVQQQRPLSSQASRPSPSQQGRVPASLVQQQRPLSSQAPLPPSNVAHNKSGSPFQLGEQDFPPLGSRSSSRRRSLRQ